MARFGDFTVLEESRLLEGQKLKIVQGDLTTISTDAIVLPTSSSFDLSGQVGTALRQAGGSNFEDDVKSVARSTGSLGVSQAVLGGAGDLPSNNVIHVHSPSYGSSNSMQQLATAVENCLEVAGQNEITTLAFPSIGSGVNGFPKVKAARRILRTIKKYFSTEISSIEEIYFVLYDQESVGIYKTELGRLRMHGNTDSDDDDEA